MANCGTILSFLRYEKKLKYTWERNLVGFSRDSKLTVYVAAGILLSGSSNLQSTVHYSSLELSKSKIRKCEPGWFCFSKVSRGRPSLNRGFYEYDGERRAHFTDIRGSCSVGCHIVVIF